MLDIAIILRNIIRSRHNYDHFGVQCHHIGLKTTEHLRRHLTANATSYEVIFREELRVFACPTIGNGIAQQHCLYSSGFQRFVIPILGHSHACSNRVITGSITLMLRPCFLGIYAQRANGQKDPKKEYPFHNSLILIQNSLFPFRRQRYYFFSTYANSTSFCLSFQFLRTYFAAINLRLFIGYS